MIKEQLAEIMFGCEEILVLEELEKKLSSGKKLIVKAGFDPTAPDIHLGHTVVLQKLATFQKFGHKIKIIIGDFTAAIGDPSGRNVTRMPLSKEDINKNAITYQNQVFKILDKDKTDVHFNSEWLDKLGSDGMIKLSSHSTVARMLERDDFKKRFANNQSISLHEFMYPLLQGYDSVALEADVELGGTDQKFNLLMGRELQKDFSMPQQVVITMPLLEGLDGVKKMSKSLDNYIGIDESPKDIFGKIMSVSDELMWKYFALVSRYTLEQISQLKQDVTNGLNPRDVKYLLGLDIVAKFYSTEEALQAKEDFINQFRSKLLPDDIMEVKLELSGVTHIVLANLLKQLNMTPSVTEGNRLIKQGAVKVNGEKVLDVATKYEAGFNLLIQVGKHKFVKVSIS